MTSTTMEKARLAAFADGELTPEEAAAVVMHLADHPEDQRYVDEVMAANEALARAFAAPMTEPVPEKMLAMIEGRTAPAAIIPFRPRRKVAFAGLALAASVALAAVLLPGKADLELSVGRVADGSDLHGLLQTLPSGKTAELGDGRELTILSTLPTETGHCREVEVVDRSASRLDLALACQVNDGWQIEVALSEALPEAVSEQGYVPAGGMESEALGQWLDRLGAGLALDPQTEAALMARGWTR